MQDTFINYSTNIARKKSKILKVMRGELNSLNSARQRAASEVPDVRCVSEGVGGGDHEQQMVRVSSRAVQVRCVGVCVCVSECVCV